MKKVIQRHNRYLQKSRSFWWKSKMAASIHIVKNEISIIEYRPKKKKYIPTKWCLKEHEDPTTFGEWVSGLHCVTTSAPGRNRAIYLLPYLKGEKIRKGLPWTRYGFLKEGRSFLFNSYLVLKDINFILMVSKQQNNFAFVCVGFVIGFVSGYSYSQKLKKKRENLFLLPNPSPSPRLMLTRLLQ